MELTRTQLFKQPSSYTTLARGCIAIWLFAAQSMDSLLLALADDAPAMVGRVRSRGAACDK